MTRAQKTSKLKLFVVRKYVWAESAAHALKKEQEIASDDVWVDEEWKKKMTEPRDAVGFQVENANEN